MMLKDSFIGSFGPQYDISMLHHSVNCAPKLAVSPNDLQQQRQQEGLLFHCVLGIRQSLRERTREMVEGATINFTEDRADTNCRTVTPFKLYGTLV